MVGLLYGWVYEPVLIVLIVLPVWGGVHEIINFCLELVWNNLIVFFRRQYPVGHPVQPKGKVKKYSRDYYGCCLVHKGRVVLNQTAPLKTMDFSPLETQKTRPRIQHIPRYQVSKGRRNNSVWLLLFGNCKKCGEPASLKTKHGKSNMTNTHPVLYTQ